MASIQVQQESISHHALVGSAYAAGATSLTITALTIIGCAALCLTLPGVNAMSQIVYPVILPCITSLVLIVPSILISKQRNTMQNGEIDHMLGDVKQELDDLPPMTPIELRDRIISVLFPMGQNYVTATPLLTKLKALYPKEPEGNDANIVSALGQIPQTRVDSEETKERDGVMEKAFESLELGASIPNVLKQIEEKLVQPNQVWKDEDNERALLSLLDYCPVGSPPTLMRNLLQTYLNQHFPKE